VCFFADQANQRGVRTTAQWNSKITYPDGKTPSLWCSDQAEGFTFEDDNYNFKADKCSMELSEDGSYFILKSSTNEGCIVDLKVTRNAPPFVAGKDGTSYFGTDHENPWGRMSHSFWPRCKVEGSMKTKSGDVDFKGIGLFIHCLQGMKPHHAGIVLPRMCSLQTADCKI
jgi:hypothetical protein